MINPFENAPVAMRPELVPALGTALTELGEKGDWLDGERRLYTRTGEAIDHAFPDVIEAMDWDGIIDGELLVLRDGEVQPFDRLQKRLGRKAPPAKLLVDNPAHIRAYDLLEVPGEDLRPLPFAARRRQLFALGLVMGTAAGIMRIVQGGHFPSDVFYAGWFMIAVAWGLHKLFYETGWVDRAAAPLRGEQWAELRVRGESFTMLSLTSASRTGAVLTIGGGRSHAFYFKLSDGEREPVELQLKIDGLKAGVVLEAVTFFSVVP